MRYLKINKKQMTREALFYVLIALASAGVDILIFTALIFLGVNLFASQAVARGIGGLTCFVLNRNYNFQRNPGRKAIEIRRFLLLYTASYLLSFLCLGFFHNLLGLFLLYAKPLGDSMCFLFNFIIMRVYVYNKSPGLIASSQGFFKRGILR